MEQTLLLEKIANNLYKATNPKNGRSITGTGKQVREQIKLGTKFVNNKGREYKVETRKNGVETLALGSKNKKPTMAKLFDFKIIDNFDYDNPTIEVTKEELINFAKDNKRFNNIIVEIENDLKKAGVRNTTFFSENNIDENKLKESDKTGKNEFTINNFRRKQQKYSEIKSKKGYKNQLIQKKLDAIDKNLNIKGTEEYNHIKNMMEELSIVDLQTISTDRNSALNISFSYYKLEEISDLKEGLEQERWKIDKIIEELEYHTGRRDTMQQGDYSTKKDSDKKTLPQTNIPLTEISMSYGNFRKLIESNIKNKYNETKNEIFDKINIDSFQIAINQYQKNKKNGMSSKKALEEIKQIIANDYTTLLNSDKYIPVNVERIYNNISQIKSWAKLKEFIER